MIGVLGAEDDGEGIVTPAEAMAGALVRANVDAKLCAFPGWRTLDAAPLARSP